MFSRLSDPSCICEGANGFSVGAFVVATTAASRVRAISASRPLLSAMHIKQIIIEGFRTYKARTVIDDISPGVNVILGKNGHGKSNIFDGTCWKRASSFPFLGCGAFGRMRHSERLFHVPNASAQMHSACSRCARTSWLWTGLRCMLSSHCTLIAVRFCAVDSQYFFFFVELSQRSSLCSTRSLPTCGRRTARAYCTKVKDVSVRVRVSARVCMHTSPSLSAVCHQRCNIHRSFLNDRCRSRCDDRVRGNRL